MVQETTPASRIIDVAIAVILILVTITCVLPLWYTLALSFSSKNAAAGGLVSLWPVGFNLDSYRQLLQDGQFFRSFGVSVGRVALGAALNFVVVPLMAYPLSKTAKDFRLRNVLMWAILFTMLFNGGLIPLYLTVKNYGLFNNIWSLVLVGGASTIVFYIILVVNFFRNLPKELEEAALVDGAGPWYILLKLYVPLSVPVLATITLFSIVYHWNEFLYGLIFMTRPEYYPLQTYIQQVVVMLDPSSMTEEQIKQMSELSNRTLDAAKIFIAMLPILVVYPFLQRFFIHGITLGSVKE